MKRSIRSLMIGAGVAALLITASEQGYGQAMNGHGDWVTAPSRNFNVHAFKLKDLVGTLTVAVRNGGPVSVEVSGNRARVGQVRFSQDGGQLVIQCPDTEMNVSVWDWKNWFNFTDTENRSHQRLAIKLSVPRGTDVAVDGLVGDAVIGDTMGRLDFEAAASKAHIGNVSDAKVELGGTGTVDIASVAHTLDLDVGGSGKIHVGSAGRVKADLAGSADAQFGAIAGGLDLDIAGSGDVTASHVNGPVSVDIAGSGSVRIADGVADPLHVNIMGAGNLYFGGMAVDPRVDAVGSGSVHIKAYHGHLSSEGMADVKIGD